MQLQEKGQPYTHGLLRCQAPAGPNQSLCLCILSLSGLHPLLINWTLLTISSSQNICRLVGARAVQRLGHEVLSPAILGVPGEWGTHCLAQHLTAAHT